MYADKATRKRMKAVNTLAITGCNVLFATRTSASASTGSGMFGEVGNTIRSEAKISQIYTLEGVSDVDMQALADGICANAEKVWRMPISVAIPNRSHLPRRAARRR